MNTPPLKKGSRAAPKTGQSAIYLARGKPTHNASQLKIRKKQKGNVFSRYSAFYQTAVAPSSIERSRCCNPQTCQTAALAQPAGLRLPCRAELPRLRRTTAPSGQPPLHQHHPAPSTRLPAQQEEPWNTLQVTAVSLSCLWPALCESRETRLFIILHFLHRVIWRSEGRRLAGLAARSRQQSETERARPTDWAKWKLTVNFCALPVSKPTSCQTVKGNQKARGNWSSA